MKIIVISDSHGDYDAVSEVMKRQRGADLFVHLGDGISEFEAAAESQGLAHFSVKGNCDFGRADTPPTATLELDGRRIMLTHGHIYGAKYGYDRLAAAARENAADIVLFGHTHRPLDLYLPPPDPENDENPPADGENIEENHKSDKGLRLFNPGSLKYDRTFGVIELFGSGILSSHGKI